MSASVDTLIEDMGNCGLFQILMILVVHSSVFTSEWSTTFMAFGNYNPGWRCNDSVTVDINADSKSRNGSQEFTSLCGNYDHCHSVIYSTDSSTPVTEWDLACDNDWITSLMLFVQGGGYLIGTFVAGILNNKIGRKPTHFGSLALHTVLNLIAIFSGSWPTFTIMRFLIGLTAGSIGVTNFIYPMEFVTDKWRAVVSGLPFTSLGALLFSLTAMWLRDWKTLHLATAVLTGLLFLSVFWVPESIRWLAVQGNTEKAERAARIVSKVNRKKAESIDLDVIHVIADCESKKGEEKNTASILDLYRHGFASRTNAATYSWVAVLVCYTIVMYGINALSGNFYLNLILFNVIPAVLLPVTPLFTNSIGRKLSLSIVMGVLALCCIGLVIVHFIQLDFNKGLATVVLSLIAMVFLQASWTIIMLYCVELYPTRLRSLSYSYACCIGRLGSMAASFLVPHDENSAFISHIVMTILTVSAWGTVFVFPETKGQYLYETFTEE